jgi:hypothetical protein
MRNLTTLRSPNVRSVGSAARFTGGYYVQNAAPGLGSCTWDKNYWQMGISWQSTSTSFWLNSPFVGFLPAPWALPRLGSSQYTTLSGSLPSITTTSVSYPLINGGTKYNTIDWNAGTLTNLDERSAHQFFSYGQNLTTSTGGMSGLSWSHVGRSSFLTLDSASLGMMFPGLGMQLTDSGTNKYLVVGLHPGLGYADVINANNDTCPCEMLGTSGTSYTGTTIGQQAYSWTQYP